MTLMFPVQLAVTVENGIIEREFLTIEGAMNYVQMLRLEPIDHNIKDISITVVRPLDN